MSRVGGFSRVYRENIAYGESNNIYRDVHGNVIITNGSLGEKHSANPC